MSRKELPEYAGDVPLDVYVVWVEGRYRIYISPGQATRRYMKAKKSGLAAKITRFAQKEVMAS